MFQQDDEAERKQATKSPEVSTVLPDDRTCPECGVRYCNPVILKRHMLIHTGETPFNCFYCEYATNRKESLMSHCIKKHEMDVEEFKSKAKTVFVGKRIGRPRKNKKDQENAE